MKKTLIVFILGFLAAAGAFAEFAAGINGALYMDDAELATATGQSIGQAFQRGEGIYYGLLLELLGKRMGVGLSFMGSTYMSSFDVQMLDADANFYVAGHILGTRALIDPFVEAGLGRVSKDYANEAEDDDPANPLTATNYWSLGGGLELNIWRLGIFTKFIYHFPLGSPVQGQITWVDEFDVTHTEPITLEAFSLKPYKVVLGAKFIF